MISYFEVTKKLTEFLLDDPNINSVKIGSLNETDLEKQASFPIGNILVNSGTPGGGIVTYDITITAMDIVNITNDLDPDPFKQDNRHYILNSMFSVLENLDKELDNGDLQKLGWELTGPVIAQPFEDRFGNLLVGWSGQFNIIIPNTVQHCKNITDAYGLDEILDNKLG